jgi:hypothetical protein
MLVQTASAARFHFSLGFFRIGPARGPLWPKPVHPGPFPFLETPKPPPPIRPRRLTLRWSWTKVMPDRLHSPTLARRLINSPPWFNVKTDEIKTHLPAQPPPLHCIPEPIKGPFCITAPHQTSCHSLFHISTPLVAQHWVPMPPFPPLRRRPHPTIEPSTKAHGEDHRDPLHLLTLPRWGFVPRSSMRWAPRWASAATPIHGPPWTIDRHPAAGPQDHEPGPLGFPFEE